MSRLSVLRLAVAAAIAATSLGVATIASQKSAAVMAKAATQFVSSLSAEQKAKAVLPFDSEDRLRAILPTLDGMVDDGLITVERVEVIAYRPGPTGS